MDGGSGNEGKRVGKPYLGRLAGSITWGKSGKGPEWVPVLCLSFIIRPLTELRKTGVGGAGLGMSMVLGKVKLSCLWGVYQIATSIWCPRGRFLARNQNPEIMSFWVDEMQSNETVKEGCIEWKKTTNLSQNLETHQYLRGKKKPEVFYHSIIFYHKMSYLKQYVVGQGFRHGLTRASACRSHRIAVKVWTREGWSHLRLSWGITLAESDTCLILLCSRVLAASCFLPANNWAPQFPEWCWLEPPSAPRSCPWVLALWTPPTHPARKRISWLDASHIPCHTSVLCWWEASHESQRGGYCTRVELMGPPSVFTRK